MAIFPKLFLTVVILISSEILISGFVILDGIVRPASIHASPKSQDDLKDELVHENARYLGEAYHGAFYGRMIHISDENNDDSGCQLPWFDNELPGHPWVALVRKGDCDFNTKVKHASKYHAAGIIIYDNATTGQLPRFNLLKNEVGDEMNTKAVFTSKGKGEELIELTKNNTNVTVYVHPGTWRVEQLEDSRIDKLKTIFRLCLLYFQKADIPKHNGPESPRSSQNAKTYPSYERYKNRNVVMVTLVVIIIVGVALIGIIYYWKKNYFDETHDEISRNMIQATQCAMLRIPTKKLKSEDLNTEEKDIDCVICFETFKIHETIRIMPCNHKFHKCCIDPWLMGHKTCPMCKLNILQYYGFSFTGSQESILQIDPDGMDDYNDDNSSIRTIRFETFSDTSDDSASPSPSENEATEENLESELEDDIDAAPSEIDEDEHVGKRGDVGKRSDTIIRLETIEEDEE